MKDDPRWEFFKCEQCGRCCTERGLPYDRESAIRIAEFLDISMSEVIEQYYGKVVQHGEPWLLQDAKGKPCPFLKKDGGKYSCKIYHIRPDGCKMYPFGTDAGCQGVDCPASRIATDRFERKSVSPDGQGDEK